MKPIIFNTETIRAILYGRKTQTRRVIKPGKFDNKPIINPKDIIGHQFYSEPFWLSQGTCYEGHYLRMNGWRLKRIDCPYGKVGDELWVRETWAKYTDTKIGISRKGGYLYKASQYINPNAVKWKPSIFMPKSASRITLKITDIRVERAQDINDKDSKAEGVDGAERFMSGGTINGKPVKRFGWLWDLINKKRGFGWGKNPWVWVIEFERVK